MKRWILAAGLTALASAMMPHAATAQQYPWMQKNTGTWSLLDPDGTKICEMSFKPVGQFTLNEAQADVDASACPAPYNEVNKWEMQEPEYLWLRKGWSTPFQGDDKDGDGVFTGYFGGRRNGTQLSLMPVSGAAAAEMASKVSPQEIVRTRVDLPAPIFHGSELLAGGWQITTGDGRFVCRLVLEPRPQSKTNEQAGDKYELARSQCPEPFSKVDFWSAPYARQLRLHNNFIVGTAFEAEDRDGDGIYQGAIDGIGFSLVPETPSRVLAYQRRRGQAGPASRWQAVSGATVLAGEYLFRDVWNGIRSECKVRLALNPRGQSEGVVVAGRACPDRLRSATRWYSDRQAGLVIEFRDGTALRGQKIEPFPLALRLRQYRGPGIQGDGHWILTRLFGPGSVDVEGNERRLPDVTQSNVVGNWTYRARGERPCEVTLAQSGRVSPGACAGFWAYWRVENGLLILSSRNQATLFTGQLVSATRIVNLDDPSEILTRNE